MCSPPIRPNFVRKYLFIDLFAQPSNSFLSEFIAELFMLWIVRKSISFAGPTNVVAYLIDEMLSSWLFLLLLLIPTQGDEREFISTVFANETAMTEGSVAENFVWACLTKPFVPLYLFWGVRG